MSPFPFRARRSSPGSASRVAVGDLHQGVPADLLLGLDERSVEDLHLAVHSLHRRGGLAHIEPFAPLDDGLVRFPPLPDRGHPPIHVLLGATLADEHEHVLRHLILPPTCRRSAGLRRRSPATSSRTRPRPSCPRPR